MKVLGIDYGKSKVGVAVGDTVTKLAEPLAVWSSSRFKAQGSKLIKENDIQKVVVGVPGGKMEEEIRKFGARLEVQTKVKVEFFDETLTTQDAKKILIQSGRKRKSRREKEDAFAAALMLQYYLEGGQKNV